MPYLLTAVLAYGNGLFYRRLPNDLPDERPLPKDDLPLLPLRLLLLPKPPEPTGALLLRVLKLRCEEDGVLNDERD
jgi:hypothetical protein